MLVTLLLIVPGAAMALVTEPGATVAPRLQTSHGLLGLESVHVTDKLILVANRTALAVWNPNTGLMVRQLNVMNMDGAEIVGSVLSADSVHAAAVLGSSPGRQAKPAHLIVWTIADGHEIHRITLPERMTLAALCSSPFRGEVSLAVVPRFNEKGNWDSVRTGQLLTVNMVSGKVQQRIGIAPNTAAVAFDQDCRRHATALRLKLKDASGKEKEGVQISVHTGDRTVPGKIVIPGLDSLYLNELALSPDGRHTAIVIGEHERLLTFDMGREDLVTRVDRPKMKIRPTDALAEVVEPFGAIQFTSPGRMAAIFGGKMAAFQLTSKFELVPPGQFPLGASVIDVDPLGGLSGLAPARPISGTVRGGTAQAIARLTVVGRSGSIAVLTSGADSTWAIQKLWEPEVSGNYVRDMARIDDDQFVLIAEGQGGLIQRFARNGPVESIRHDIDIQIDSVAHLPGSPELVVGTKADVRRIPLDDGRSQRLPDRPRSHIVQQTVLGDNSFKNSTICLDIDAKGQRIAWCVNDEVRILKRDQMKGHPNQLRVVSTDALLPMIRLLPDNDTLIMGEYMGDHATLYSTIRNKVLCQFRDTNSQTDSENFVDMQPMPDGGQVLIADDKQVAVWRTDNCSRITTVFDKIAVDGMAISPNGRRALVVGENLTVHLLRTDTWSTEATFVIPAVAFKDKIMFLNERFVLSKGGDGALWVWDVDQRVLAAQIFLRDQGNWVVVAPDGRFDTSDFEELQGLAWYSQTQPLEGMPIEIFMREYFEPKLLSRILNGETFKPTRGLGALNRVQPKVKISKIDADPAHKDYINVTVSATGATKFYLQGEKEIPRPTAVHDLRLFRDGQVVGYADGKLADFKGAAFSKTFTVRLPKDKAGQDIVFSAYAFNDDRVKSETVRSTYKAPELPTSTVASKGKAYVISMGVNSHDNAAWNLNFAANDARLVRQSVSEKLAKSSQYKEVITITLISDKKEQQASKAALHAMLDRLAGKPLNAAATALLQSIQGADKLQTATPDDLFLLSFSGHGFADDSGNFYLIPQDTGSGSGKAVTAELRQHSISSEELSQWLRDVDAGDMTMIVDACQSAATVGNDFKPGPMGSRGLGQLSFDKGMRILAASQSDEVALEDGRIQQGLLSYALVKDGLDQQKADYMPLDKKITLKEWLNYGVSRVPSLADDVKSGKLVAARSTVSVSADGKIQKTATQQPSLFDFTKGRRDVVLEAGIR